MFRLVRNLGFFHSGISKFSVEERLQLVRTMHSLIKNQAYVDGKWTDSREKKTFDVINPANLKIIGNVPDMDVKDVEKAIDAAYDAFHSQEWQNKTAKDRSNLLKKWFTLLEANKAEIAEIMTSESGKPLAESFGEITYGNSFIEWFAEEARRIYGEVVPSPVASKSITHTKHPIGVAGLITPWNFPHAMITRKAGAALAAGCTVVIKPAEDTPLTALALCKLADEVGFPPGVINVITSSRSNAAPIGELLCKSPKVAGISFTGSTEVGKLLYRQCADGVKRIGLELGGNAPFIVFKSANIDHAVAGALASKFRNCGQTCISANRFLIQDDVCEEFIGKLINQMKCLSIGDGACSCTKIGPLINEAQLKKVKGMVEDAKQKGAKIVHGGRHMKDIGELFFEPTIITDIKPDMKLYTDEVFGPIVSIIPFKSEEQALKIANGTQRGLAGYFFTQDLNQAFRVRNKLEVGMVGINEGLISSTEAAFGGIKESGVGREGSSHGIEEYVYIKYSCFGNLN
ncbi:CLUMA_CG002132, isoform A [Clunio marinus]|uniref:CLUMA_CG002132, isoform A n=1 Tax=Clunio marinus TaxID=568069 RepID=A0A1J1HKA4_9DIPT|nr:CLUMA_CG002132, isoform A [Clunio marinus]